MAHYARVVDGIVEEVIVCDDIEICNSLERPGEWIQTSYNTWGGIHRDSKGVPDGGVALRGNYAGIGYTYDSDADVFIRPAPFPSWVLNTTNHMWEAPVPRPAKPETGRYRWDESALEWGHIIPTRPDSDL